MKKEKVSVPVTISGERFILSGDPEKINRVVEIFRETEDRVARRHRGREASTNRIGALAGLALAEEVLRERMIRARLVETARRARRLLSEVKRELDPNGTSSPPEK